MSGGIGAELIGGNFWEGAVIGGIVAGLNHAMHRVDNDHEWMLTKDGKTVKVGNKGGDQIDYLYDEHYGPVLDRPLLAVAEVEHSTVTTGNFSSGGHSTESGFGYRIHRKFGGHGLIDDGLSLMPVGRMGHVMGKGIGHYLTRTTGGMKQWIRIGNSFSHAGGFKTYSIRWGAGGKHWQKIGNPTLQKWNRSFRQTKLPGNGWRTQDPGHFHLKKIK